MNHTTKTQDSTNCVLKQGALGALLVAVLVCTSCGSSGADDQQNQGQNQGDAEWDTSLWDQDDWA